ncbi:phospholipase A2-like [Clarias gariepinus]|uniref:phospholipase A2-like n=1 Tax=Clarias gariepinus TaxID=13013 RepID=UPI00234C4426|nr:phospholipase A2-like [Clarias gariepinus]
MKAVYWTFLLLSVSTASLADERSMRSKRSVVNLAGVIKCTTDRLAISYVGYGCYCGLGGKGWPIDNTDWCCHEHDCCYQNVVAAGCKTLTNNYRWTCKNHQVICDSINDRCDKMLCKCDSELAQCIRKAPYNSKYALWPNDRCGSKYPTCKK